MFKNPGDSYGSCLFEEGCQVGPHKPRGQLCNALEVEVARQPQAPGEDLKEEEEEEEQEEEEEEARHWSCFVWLRTS